MPNSIQQRVVATIAATQHIPAEKILPESTFQELGIDSLDGINIVFALENEFNITVPDQAVEQIKTIGDLIAGIEKLLGGEAAEVSA